MISLDIKKTQLQSTCTGSLTGGYEKLLCLLNVQNNQELLPAELHDGSMKFFPLTAAGGNRVKGPLQ